MTLPTEDPRIQNLKGQFERIDQDSDDSDIVVDDLDARLTTLHLAIASHTLNTLETALDQISICFAVSKMIFFYADDIVKNPEFWDEENNVNRMLCSNNFEMAAADMKFADNTLDHEVSLLQAAATPDQAVVLETLGMVERYQQLVGRFHEASSTLTELSERKIAGLPLYGKDLKSDLQNLSSYEVLKNLNLASSQNAETAIRQNIEAATISMTALHLLLAKGSPQFVPLEKQVALVLNRFEALQDARDNRYGYTQVRFE